ncbi:Gas vesicle protein K [Desulfocicer vacuolatum DSM 3385]|uniref:Gas vesicle protein K n=1 Tax=Desulfocicer vacuolatum DSM 3385 TaxID=1121400 RepID=A0A1W2BDV5_9BACT|nr:gas vesicle protein K [Desulfocicer vacuolatum]SMC70930.1 Gas vesicle protein K [Desulfocicer vacuolatum DSM 3385]
MIKDPEAKDFKIESDSIDAFARVMHADTSSCSSSSVTAGQRQQRLKIDEENIKNGLAQLVMTLIKLLHELLERQAIRRIESGSLDDDQIERLGLTLMQQCEEIDRLRKLFDLEEEDLNLDLGPLGKLL